MSVTAVRGERVRALTRGPRESQADFRVLLDALARPGTIGRLDVPAGVPAALVPAAGLADVEVPTAVLAGAGEEGWAGALYAATGAPPASPETARMVVALRPLGAGEIAVLPRGDALAPELGTRLILAVPSLDPFPGEGVTVELTGPGVPGTRWLRVTGVDAAVLGALAEANASFPAGIDTFLVDAGGRLAGLPRTTRVRVVRDTNNGEG